ncbi:MAG: transposase [Phycisphaerales bacterium]|nr:transposase [Phycisphaerales bacterium]
MSRTPKMKRIEAPNHIRFLTFSCYQQLPLFNNDRIKDAFVDHIHNTRTKTNFHLIFWVIMPEHVHLLIWPDIERAPVSKIVWHLKREFAKKVIGRWNELDAPILSKIRTMKGEFRFWQHGGGYDRNITSQLELEEKLHYIHQNPVKRGLAPTQTDWPWSSASWYAGCREHTIPIDPPIKPKSRNG